MKIYNRYLLKKIATAFLGVASVLVLLIWFSKTISFVHFVTENGVELSKFFLLFLLILPWLLLFIVPISLLISLLVVYNRMIASNEISILKNSGLTKMRICASSLWIAVLASTFCFITSFYLMPYANKELRINRRNFSNNYANLFFNAKTFETINNLTIYTRQRDENDNLLGIMLYDERSSNYSLTITAKSGHIKIEDESALLYMSDGTAQKFNYNSANSEILYFENYVFNLSENQKTDEKFKWKVKERYLNELLNPQEPDVTSEELNSYRNELHQRFTYPLLPIIFALIASASILHGEFNRRGNGRNIILAVTLSILFLSLNITSYRMIETSAKMVPILYANIAIFVIISLRMLNEKSRRK